MEAVIPGFTEKESSIVFDQIRQINGNLAKSVGMTEQQWAGEIRTSAWPTISKAVSGGLQHVISVDNGANYAELWHRAGNWYAVTGAIEKSGDVGDWQFIDAIGGVNKGMSITEVVPLFLKATNLCGCSGK